MSILSKQRIQNIKLLQQMCTVQKSSSHCDWIHIGLLSSEGILVPCKDVTLGIKQDRTLEGRIEHQQVGQNIYRQDRTFQVGQNISRQDRTLVGRIEHLQVEQNISRQDRTFIGRIEHQQVGQNISRQDKTLLGRIEYHQAGQNIFGRIEYYLEGQNLGFQVDNYIN